LVLSTRNTAYRTKAYLHHEISYSELGKDFDKLAEIKNNSLSVNLSKIWKDLEHIYQIDQRNAEIGQEIKKLADHSISKSNEYIRLVSEKLADDDLRSKVSKLERMVIIRANENTSSNYEIKVLFEQLKSDFRVKSPMLSFLENSIQNAEIGKKHLAGTPFETMPQASQQANFRVRELTLEYIKNMEASLYRTKIYALF